jgi:hypothetical protein
MLDEESIMIFFIKNVEAQFNVFDEPLFIIKSTYMVHVECNVD